MLVSQRPVPFTLFCLPTFKDIFDRPFILTLAQFKALILLSIPFLMTDTSPIIARAGLIQSFAL